MSSTYHNYQSYNLTNMSMSSGLAQQINHARPAPSNIPSRARLDGDSNFSVVLEPTSTSGGRYRYEIYLAGDKPDYDNRVDYGYGRNAKQAEKKARQHIDKILAPYKPKPTLANFVPNIVKRVV